MSLCSDLFPALERQYPYVVTASVRARGALTYPSAIIANHLYLGDWDHACNKEALKEQRIKHVVSIHNNPAGVTVSKHIADSGRHTQLGLADVPTEDITKHFDAAFDAIDCAARRGERVLVHCGAGVSRSATLCAMYLMRKKQMGPHAAVAHCRDRRSCVEPNHGFIVALRQLAEGLGLDDDTPVEVPPPPLPLHADHKGAFGGAGGGADGDGGGDGDGWGAQLRHSRGSEEASAAAAATADAIAAGKAATMAEAITARAVREGAVPIVAGYADDPKSLNL